MTLLLTIVLIAWLLTFATLILNLLTVPRLRVRQPRGTPLVSVIIPARDEERAIESTVRALLAQTYRALEVIVVNDRSTDATGEILARIAAEDPRLVVLTGEEPSPGWLGKPWALAQGSRTARGKLLLFVDADILYQPDAVAAAVAEMEARGAPMITLFPRFVMRGFWEHVAMPNLPLFGFLFLPLWLSNRTTITALGAGGGTGNLVRRDVYDSLGGHDALKDSVVDDVALARLFRRGGHRTLFFRADDFVSVRMYHGLREVVHGFTKNLFSVFGRSYPAAAFFFFGAIVFHLLPYVLAAFGNRLALAIVGVITLARLIFFAAAGYRIDNALFGHPPMMLVWQWITLRSVWYTGIRRQLLWRGRTYDAKATRFGAD
ncbi:MAG: chlorobactene glucosyltransferase [Acidobacteriota bacterium]|jgi:glycosyltransferase involved in cell wall biosynthesis|nr:chlorobactene glucosyltransferase [Acidobacteriota bacterium]